jgi:hypothetical protein
VEQATRIRLAYLRALEADDFHRLPAPVYTRGFVRNYAAFLDLHPDHMVRLYEEAIGYQPEPVRIEPPRTVRLTGPLAPNVAAIGVVAVLATIVFVWLYSAFYGTGPTRPSQVPSPAVPTPTALTSLAASTTATVPLLLTPTVPAPAPPTPAGSPTAIAQATVALVPSPTLPAARSSPSPTAEPGTFSLRLQIVDAPSWLQVRTDGVVVFSGTMAPGSVRTFRAKSEIFVHAGRSDAVDVALDGVAQGRLGKEGQSVVRRLFTRQGTAIATAVAFEPASRPVATVPGASARAGVSAAG